MNEGKARRWLGFGVAAAFQALVVFPASRVPPFLLSLVAPSDASVFSLAMFLLPASVARSCYFALFAGLAGFDWALRPFSMYVCVWLLLLFDDETGGTTAWLELEPRAGLDDIYWFNHLITVWLHLTGRIERPTRMER